MKKLHTQHLADAWLDELNDKQRIEYWLDVAQEAAKSSDVVINHILVLEYRYNFNQVLLCETSEEYRLHRAFESNHVVAEWHRTELCVTT